MFVVMMGVLKTRIIVAYTNNTLCLFVQCRCTIPVFPVKGPTLAHLSTLFELRKEETF